MRWSKEVNKVVKECFYKRKPFDENGRPISGYRQQMLKEWRLRCTSDSMEQRICDRARTGKLKGEVQNDADGLE